MTLVRWRPTRDLMGIRDEFDRLADQFLGRISEEREFDALLTPSVDVSETDDTFTVAVELPGVSKDDVKISVVNNTLVLQGQKKQEKNERGKNFHRLERSYGAFQRSIELPASIDPNKIKARFKDGILKVDLSKLEEAKPKEISISVE